MKGPVEEIDFLAVPDWKRDVNLTLRVPEYLNLCELETWKRNVSKLTVLKYPVQRIPEALLDSCLAGGALRVLQLRLSPDDDAQAYAIRCANQCPNLECIILDGASASQNGSFHAWIGTYLSVILFQD
jgi:hypothetical protein